MLSIVIPIYNEQDIVSELHNRLTSALSSINTYEVILVDDGSTDNSLNEMIKLHKLDSRFKIISLSRNFGHQAAYTAGLNHAKGDYIAMLDGDLQDPPELINDLYKKLIDGDFDIVYARKKKRKEPFLRRTLMKSFHKLYSNMSNVKAPADVGNFSIMNRMALNAFLSLNEKNRYLPGLRHFIGFKQGFVDYERPDRTIGEPKMGFRKLFKLAFDAIFSFSDIPIKICLFIGILGICISSVGASIVLYKKLHNDAIPGWTSTLLSIYFFSSVQLVFLGIVGEYIYRVFVETQNRPIYFIRKIYE